MGGGEGGGEGDGEGGFTKPELHMILAVRNNYTFTISLSDNSRMDI